MNKDLFRNQWFEIIQDMLHVAGIAVNGARPFDIQVNNQNLYQRVLRQGLLGLGESYMDGWWDCQRLDIFFERVIRAGMERRFTRGWLKNAWLFIGTRLFNLQSKKRALIVGKEHYDLGNDLFGLMLDSHMQYSCGYWKEAETLEQAQLAKLQLICQKLQLKPGMRLLDIGCGWGGLAAYAVKNYGVSVLGVTISEQQKKLAHERCRGLDVQILLQDYRDLQGQFDRVVSVGMFEHVGPKNYRAYFDAVQRCLKPDGIFLLHTIGSNKTDMQVDPWIDKYIFPNGCLPSLLHISQATEGRFVLEDLHNIGADYDRTLMAWYERFNQAWPQLSNHYSERFRRMFSYYLNMCAGAFRARNIQLWQIVFSSQGIAGGLRVAR